MKHFGGFTRALGLLAGALSVLLALSSQARAGDWVLDDYVISGSSRSQEMRWSNDPYNHKFLASVAAPTQWTARNGSFDEGAANEFMVCPSPASLSYDTEWDTEQSEWQNAAVHNTPPTLNGKMNFSIHAVFKWKRNQFYDGNGELVNDPNDDPPKYLYVREKALVSGHKSIGRYGWPISDHYNAAHPWSGGYYKVEGSFSGSSGWQGELGPGHRYEDDYASWNYSDQKERVIKIAVKGDVEKKGLPTPSVAFKGTLQLNPGYEGEVAEVEAGVHSNAMVWGGYGAEVVSTSFTASHDVEVRLNWHSATGTNGNAYDAAQPYWEGIANLGASATVDGGSGTRNSLYNPQEYHWSHDGDGELKNPESWGWDESPEAEAGLSDTERQQREMYQLKPSTSNKELHFKLSGDLTTDNFWAEVGKFPKSDSFKVKITGADSGEEPIEGKTKVNWVLPWMRVYKAKIYIFRDGSTPNPDGSVTHPDGSVTNPDGSVTHPDGSVTPPDGSVRHPDGSITHPDGSTTHPDGSVTNPDGSVTPPDNTGGGGDGGIHDAATDQGDDDIMARVNRTKRSIAPIGGKAIKIGAGVIMLPAIALVPGAGALEAAAISAEAAAATRLAIGATATGITIITIVTDGGTIGHPPLDWNPPDAWKFPDPGAVTIDNGNDTTTTPIIPGDPTPNDDPDDPTPPTTDPPTTDPPTTTNPPTNQPPVTVNPPVSPPFNAPPDPLPVPVPAPPNQPAPAPGPGNPSPPAPTPTPPPVNWVVRGGAADPRNLQGGWSEHLGAPGVFGCSIQYQPGLGVDALAAAGQFKNKQISYAEDAMLVAVAASAGYKLDFVKTPGRGFHYTLTAQIIATGEVVKQLPLDLATLLSATFQRKANPAPVP